MAQGWPKDYPGVMLQGFFWDSYNDTQWTRLEKQANDSTWYGFLRAVTVVAHLWATMTFGGSAIMRVHSEARLSFVQ